MHRQLAKAALAHGAGCTAALFQPPPAAPYLRGLSRLTDCKSCAPLAAGVMSSVSRAKNLLLPMGGDSGWSSLQGTVYDGNTHQFARADVAPASRSYTPRKPERVARAASPDALLASGSSPALCNHPSLPLANHT